MKPRRIVLYTWSHRVHGQRWARGLSERGLDVRVVSHGGEKIPGIDTVIVPPRKRWGKLSYIATARQAARAAVAFDPDLIHGHYAAGFGYWAWRTRIRPKVISVWGSDVVDFPNDPIRHWLLRTILLSADAVTATSDHLKRAATMLSKKLSDRTEVIPFGVEMPASVSPPPAEPPLRLCYIKGHHYIYGPDVLLKALAQVRQRGFDVTLTLAGQGEITGELKQLCTRLGLDRAVTFSGFIDNACIYDFLSEHHVMVMPSQQEAFGVAVLEAGAAGRPVIATDVGGIREVLRHEQTGLMVPPNDVGALADAIARMAQQPELRNNLGTGAREFVRSEFIWRRSLDLMIDLYERLIHEGAEGS